VYTCAHMYMCMCMCVLASAFFTDTGVPFAGGTVQRSLEQGVHPARIPPRFNHRGDSQSRA
jgi:hypothetical protein